jgi:L-threonylcarbamoyladenylate synthase
MHLKTEILSSNREGTARAAQILNAGGLVAFPTETVYGLGADCTNPVAIEKIYKAKGRPDHNPLIIHAYDVEEASKFVQMDPKATKLADSFWPGPLTLVLEQKTNLKIKIVGRALSKLSTVAVRVPTHPIAREILSLCRRPIAAPSANISGKLSTTRFEDVLECLSGKVNAIVDGGPCPIGVESTIVKVENGHVFILRPGKITLKDIKSLIGEVRKIDSSDKKDITSPGQLSSHYCPETPIRLNVLTPRGNELLLAFGPLPVGVKGLSLSEIYDPDEAAMNLYSALADLDHLAKITKSNSIGINPIPESGIGLAIIDRLKRAANKSEK